MKIGMNIKNIREQKGLSQKQLGQLLGVTQQTIGQLENNKTSPKLETIERVAEALGVPVSTLTSMTIGEKIKEVRQKAGLTQKALAEKTGLATGTIQQYEYGLYEPNTRNIGKLAAALGVLPGDLLQDGIYPTSQEMTAMRRAAENVTDERKAEIEEKRLGNLIKRKAELLNNTGKQKAVDYMTDLSGHPDYKK